MSATDIDVVANLAQLEYTIDYFWTQFAGIVVLLMQLGFAFLEGGCVRYKNMQSIMIKVFLNTCIAVLCWWICGYGIAMGRGDFIGDDYYTGSNMRDTKHLSVFVLFTAVGAAANSIVSGGAAERMSIPGYCLLSLVFSAFIYPVAAHWTWGGGWLQQMGYLDLAGSGTIHFMAAVGALTLTVMLKPRKNRWTHPEQFNPSNTIYICLATLSLYTCWIFFNAGSTMALSGEFGYDAARATCNTMIAGASGGLTVMLLHYIAQRNEKQRYSLVMICNGNLAGLVAVTGSCDGIELWAAVVIGILGGFAYVGCAGLLHKLQIDDPVDAFPIHGACGFIGAQFPGWFNVHKGIFYGHSAYQWGVQVLGLVVWFGWSLVLHLIVIILLKVIGALRVDDQTEIKGLDNTLCGGMACDIGCLENEEPLKIKANANDITPPGKSQNQTKQKLLTTVGDIQQQQQQQKLNQ